METNLGIPSLLNWRGGGSFLIGMFKQNRERFFFVQMNDSVRQKGNKRKNDMKNI